MHNGSTIHSNPPLTHQPHSFISNLQLDNITRIYQHNFKTVKQPSVKPAGQKLYQNERNNKVEQVIIHLPNEQPHIETYD